MIITTTLIISYISPSYSARYTFSGKERDEETGYSYFGARYYNSSYSIWLSVDPMSDKYPSLSPYAYCADNPIKLVDPNGREISGPDGPPNNRWMNKVSEMAHTVGNKVGDELNKLDFMVMGTAENRFCEGHSDIANQGTITKQDIEVGVAVVATMITLGAGIEAEGIGSAIVTGMSTINNVDDATVNSTEQTFLQRETADSPVASKTINIVKTVTPVASATSSAITIVKKGIMKAATCVADVATSTYSFVKSLFANKKSNE